MTKALRSTPPQAQSPQLVSGRADSRPRTATAAVCLWLLWARSRSDDGSAGWSRSTPVAALLAVLDAAGELADGIAAARADQRTSARAFTALPMSVAVALALLLIQAPGSSVAGKFAPMIAAVTGPPARCALLATAWRASSRRDCPLKRQTARY
jgi:hypothetical protein